MAIGERIRFLRNLHGATQKWLGLKLGFSEKTAEWLQRLKYCINSKELTDTKSVSSYFYE